MAIKCGWCGKDITSQEPRQYGVRAVGSGVYCCSACRVNAERAWQESRDEFDRNFEKLFGASILASREAKQQEQQARQERAQELNAAAKEYGFTDAAEALKWAKEAGVAGTTDETEFFEKAAEKKKKFDEFVRENRAYIAKCNKEVEKNSRHFRKQLQSVMTEEQKEKHSVLRKESEHLFNIGTLKNTLFALELIFVPVLGILLYCFLPRSINFLRIYGFWTTLFTSLAIAFILKDPVEIAISKNRVKKIAEIKGDDDFPFYELSDGYLRYSLRFSLSVYMRFGVCLLISILVFRYSIYIPIKYLKWILRILSILLPVWVFIDDDQNNPEKIKDGFEITRDDVNEYCIYKYIRKEIGQFCIPRKDSWGFSVDRDLFSDWCIDDILNLYGWKYTFLPEKENPEFKEKYGFLTTSKYFSLEDIKNDYWEQQRRKGRKMKGKIKKQMKKTK